MMNKFINNKVFVPILTILLIVGVFILFFNPFSNTNSSSPDISKSSNSKKTLYSKYPDTIVNIDKDYLADIKTDKGDIKIKLLTKIAPKTVNSFVYLAKNGFYDSLLFHRVIPDFVIQGGDPNGDGTGSAGYSYEDEINPKALGLTQEEIDQNIASSYSYNYSLESIKIGSGVVAMANSGPNTNGSQFFISLKDNFELDGKYTAFGIVTEGMDVAKSIASVGKDSNDKPLVGVFMKSITITEISRN